jgi:hypothetical protein
MSIASFGVPRCMRTVLHCGSSKSVAGPASSHVDVTSGRPQRRVRRLTTVPSPWVPLCSRRNPGIQRATAVTIGSAPEASAARKARQGISSGATHGRGIELGDRVPSPKARARLAFDHWLPAHEAKCPGLSALSRFRTSPRNGEL